MEKIDCYVISFDECLNDMTQNCQMDILFRFYDTVEDRGKVPYFDSEFLEHSTHSNLFDQFMQAVSKLDSNKMYQISIDGPSANLKFLEKVNKGQVVNEYWQLCSSKIISRFISDST